MVGTSGFWLCQQRSPWESSASRKCMIAPTEHRQHEFLPASLNTFRASAESLGLNGLNFSSLPQKDLLQETYGLFGKPVSHYQSPVLTQYGYVEEQTSLHPLNVDVPTSTLKAPSPLRKKFVIFDRCGNETKLVYSSLWPQVHNEPVASVSPSGAHQHLAERCNKLGQAEACIKTPIVYEESGENDTVDEGSKMREDTEEINALLYSDEEYGSDTNCGKDDDDEVSTGHSPLAAKWEKQDFDEVDSIDVSSKRQKALDGGCNKVPLLCTTTNGKRNALYENMLFSACDEGVGPTIGNKRTRKDKIHDTLRVLESIIPDLKSKDPLVILDEAISYLKSLKSNLETIFMEEDDPYSSSCYEPSN